MSARATRKKQLSEQTLKLVDKYLPENNAEQPDGFPVSFSDFCAFTNVRDVTIIAIKQSQRKSYKIYLENENCIRAQEYNFYLKFYKSPESRIHSPYCDIIVNSTCPKEQSELVMSYPKNVAQNFPVSFETFCKYTNYDEIVDKAIKALKLKIYKNSSEWQKYARKLYREFYTSKEKRQKFNIRIKPCTKTFKEKLLQYAGEGENPATESPKRPQCVNTLKEQEEQPAPKRQRLNSQVDAQTNVEEVNADIFPVNYDTFLMHTNVKDLAERYLKNNSDAISSCFHVVEFTKKLYVEFYTRPRYENPLFNELFVRQNYADIITSFSDVQMALDVNSSERNRQNEVAGTTWCVKWPKEFEQKYLNTKNDACMHNNNSSNSLCRNENMGNKEKVVIQSVKIIKPPIIALQTMSPSGLNESESNRLDPSETQLSQTNDNVETYQSNQSTELPENVKIHEKEALENTDKLQNTVQTHEHHNIDAYESELNRNICHEEPDQIMSNLDNIVRHGDLIESDQVAQDEAVKITPKKGSEIVAAHNDSSQHLQTSSAPIDMPTMPTMPDQSLNVVENEIIHGDREKMQLVNEQNDELTGRQTNENLQLETDPDERLTERNIPERRASTKVLECTEAQHKTNVCQSSTLTDHKINEMWHYPISFTHFCKYAKLQDVVESIRKKRIEENSIENSDATWLNIAREIYENFYTDSEKRQEYAICFKPLPDVKRKKVFEFASKVENKVKEKIAEEPDQTDCNECESVVFLPSTTKPCEEKTISKNEQKSETEIEDTKDGILNSVDSVELAMRAIFDDDNMETNEVEEEEAPKNSTTSAENSANLMNEDNQPVISDERCIDVYQKRTNSEVPSNMEVSPQRDFLRTFSQLQSESLLQPSDLCNSPIPEGTMTTDNFIAMPNTQEQCESLSENHTNILPQPDPLKETIPNHDSQQQNQNNRQSLSKILPKKEEAAPSSKNESFTDVDAKAKEELIKKKVFPLKNLIFELNSSDDFDVHQVIEEPVLLNDSQDSAAFIFGTGRDFLRVLVNRLPSVANLEEIQEGDDETFMCPEAQRLPSTLSFEAHQATSILPEEIIAQKPTSTLPDEIIAQKPTSTLPEEITAPQPISEDVEKTNIPSTESQPQKPQNESTKPPDSGKQKRAHYRVVKSKNFAYEVPQILHALRPLPVTGQKQPNRTVSTRRSSAK